MPRPCARTVTGRIVASIGERLRQGPLVGTFLQLPALESVDIVASSGFDLAVIDREHSQLVEGDGKTIDLEVAAFKTGQEVIFRQGAGSSGNLVDGTSYWVIVDEVDADPARA